MNVNLMHTRGVDGWWFGVPMELLFKKRLHFSRSDFLYSALSPKKNIIKRTAYIL